MLAEGFEEDEGDAVGEVKRARGFVIHGDAEPAVGMLVEERLGEAGGFAAEDEIVVGRELDVAVAGGAVGFDKPKARAGGEGAREVGPVLPAFPIDVLPIIHPGAFELLVVELKSKRLNQMQRGAGRGAEAGDVAGVGRNFGFEQNDVHGDVLRERGGFPQSRRVANSAGEGFDEQPCALGAFREKHGV